MRYRYAIYALLCIATTTAYAASVDPNTTNPFLEWLARRTQTRELDKAFIDAETKEADYRGMNSDEFHKREELRIEIDTKRAHTRYRDAIAHINKLKAEGVKPRTDYTKTAEQIAADMQAWNTQHKAGTAKRIVTLEPNLAVALTKEEKDRGVFYPLEWIPFNNKMTHILYVKELEFPIAVTIRDTAQIRGKIMTLYYATADTNMNAEMIRFMHEGEETKAN